MFTIIMHLKNIAYLPVQKKTSIYFAIELNLWKGAKFLKKLWKGKFLSWLCVLEKSRTLHISLLNVNQSLKNRNLWLGLKLKILPLRWSFFFLFFLQLSNTELFYCLKQLEHALG